MRALALRAWTFCAPVLYNYRSKRDTSGIRATKSSDSFFDEITLPDYETMKENKRAYAESFRIQYENTDPFTGKVMVEEYPNGIYVVQNPPQEPLTQEEIAYMAN